MANQASSTSKTSSSLVTIVPSQPHVDPAQCHRRQPYPFKLLSSEPPEPGQLSTQDPRIPRHRNERLPNKVMVLVSDTEGVSVGKLPRHALLLSRPSIYKTLLKPSQSSSFPSSSSRAGSDTMSSLPPGCRFYPSEEQLLRYYLSKKNSWRDGDDHDHDVDNGSGDIKGYDLIKELDLYSYEPFGLPENVSYPYGCGGRRTHWYCYTKAAARVSKEKRRKAKGGYWRRVGRVRDVVLPRGDAVAGTRTKFVFYLRNSANGDAKRTDRVLYEYALLDHLKASYVLCRVFVKSRGGNSLSENALSSGAEESVSAVRSGGIQHDGSLAPDNSEPKVCHVNSADRKNDFSTYPVRQRSELVDPVATRSVAGGLNINEPVIAPRLNDGNILVDSKSLLDFIKEEDFIELDDLKD